MDKYFSNIDLLQNTLLPYFCNETSLKLINKKFLDLDYEKYNTPLQPHGIIKTFHKNGKFKEIETYKNGKLDGSYEKWYSDGKQEFVKNYKNGKLNSSYRVWYKNSQLNIKCWYKNGELDGLYESWYDNGQLMYKINYKNGKQDGLYEEWYIDGRLRERSNWKNDKLHGLREKSWNVRDSDEQYTITSNYKNGKPVIDCVIL